MGKHIKNI